MQIQRDLLESLTFDTFQFDYELEDNQSQQRFD